MRHAVERVVEHRAEAVPQLRIGHELGVGQEPDRFAEQVDPRERVRLARQQQDRARDRGPVPDAGPDLGSTWPMHRVAEQHQREDGVVRCRRIGREEARDSAAVRVAADRHARRVGELGSKRRDRVLRFALGEVDRDGLDAALAEARHVGAHRFAGSGRTVTQHEHEAIQRAVWPGLSHGFTRSASMRSRL